MVGPDPSADRDPWEIIEELSMDLNTALNMARRFSYWYRMTNPFEPMIKELDKLCKKYRMPGVT